ncbi:metallophosphoesterase family protein [Cerasicoccus fimbriatus]|uniref:metallophosphoesterase family protein n=1 Tax=Cerasicoccus fimbriatus TaxID=3014554 RepID=UPI0022B4B73D|nr:metallophosphoesterase family protein [Cerasicoccus sp. TK19100]
MATTWAIGDVHGQAELLKTLLDYLPLHREDTIIFMGDLIDRGPDSAGVLALVHQLQRTHKVIYLRGNHEAMALKARNNRSAIAHWIDCGGDATLESYRANTFDDIPEADWALLQSSHLYHETERDIYVHANLDPDIPMASQSESDLLWRFLEDPPIHQSGKFVICGHTEQSSGLPRFWGSGICIDTLGTNGRGWLSAVNAQRRAFWQVNDQNSRRCDTFEALSQ